ncbi:MAG TPA: hypothetical protein VI078_10475 [bacterium]
MRTTILHAVAGRALAALGVLAVLALTADPVRADETPVPQGDKISEIRLEAGYHVVDTSDNGRLLFPYEPFENSLTLGFDLLYLTPGFGTLQAEGSYLGEKAWDAGFEYNHGADVDLKASTRAFVHQDEHKAAVPRVRSGSIEVDADDADPDAEYVDERRESTASLKVRVPSYPAHLRASGRVMTHKGDQQLRYFYRSCSTHLCHVNQRSRELDQETREFAIGFDTHAGPVDIAYTRSARTFEDNAPDPVDAVGTINNGLPAGSYVHDVNPDLSSYADTVTLNSNLTNRIVFSGSYEGGEQENDMSGVERRTHSAGGSLSWRVAQGALVTARYTYDDERSGDLSAEARALRDKNNEDEAAEGFTHQHAVEPERTRNTVELSARVSPFDRLDLTPRLRYRTLERYAILWMQGDSYVDKTQKTASTLADLGARYRLSQQLQLDGSLGNEWTDDPVYALENSTILRYGLGGSWTPAAALLVRLSWQGYRGENDVQDALQRAYAARAPYDDLDREVNGDAFSALVSYAPTKAVSLSAACSLADNGIDQDMIFGSPDAPTFSFLSRDTEWTGRVEMLDLRASWAVTKRVTLTAEGMWIDSLEHYAPTFPEGGYLKQISTVDFTKLYATLAADVRLTERFGLLVSGSWADFEDRVDDANDGSTLGATVGVNVRW